MPRPSTVADPAYRALHDACERTPPPCTGDERFTADEPSALEVAYMRSLCNRCPVQGLCADYARASRPTGGFWAGRLRTANEKANADADRA